MNQIRRTGFTLIELSIVLVIIGLIVGGVLVGQDLIRAATLRAVISEQERLQTAVNTYELKFNQLPGDDPTAQVHFGAAACPDPGTSAGNLCNGNGDGLISGSRIVDVYEQFHVAQHLALAGLIPGAGILTGEYGGPPGTIAAPSKLNNAYWWIGHSESVSNPSICGQVGHFLAITYVNTFAPGWGGNPVLNVPDSQGIDMKIDDGNPTSGGVLAQNGAGVISPACVNGNEYAANGGTYATATTTLTCNLIFRADF